METMWIGRFASGGWMRLHAPDEAEARARAAAEAKRLGTTLVELVIDNGQYDPPPGATPAEEDAGDEPEDSPPAATCSEPAPAIDQVPQSLRRWYDAGQAMAAAECEERDARQAGLAAIRAAKIDGPILLMIDGLRVVAIPEHRPPRGCVFVRFEEIEAEY